MSTCWPGRCPCQPATCSRRLFTRGVSTTMSRTSASCHTSRRAGTAAVSITVVSLLFPRIAVIVIAQRLPETAFIPFHEAQSPQPFGAFPEVEMRHEQPGRAAMHRQKRQALVAGRDHALATHEIRDGKVRR